MEVVVAQPLIGKALQGRHVDRPPICPRLAEAHVIEEDNEYIRGIFGCLDLELRGRCSVPDI
jgi:hypothetical protein